MSVILSSNRAGLFNLNQLIVLQNQFAILQKMCFPISFVLQ